MKTDADSGRRTKRRTPTWSALSLNRATSPPPPPRPPLTILPPRLTMKKDAESGRRTKLRTRTWSALSLNPATSPPPPPPPPQFLTTIPPRPPPPSMKDEIRKLSGEMVRYLLFRNRQRPNVPVTRTQLMRLIPSTYSRRLIGHVIAKAKKWLQSVFGLELQELKRKRSKSRASSSSGEARFPPQLCREYILKSAIPESLLRKYVSGPAQASARLSFALLVVAVVKLSGGEKMPEEELFTHLRRVGVTPEAEHPVFGHVGRALNALARQRYIRKERPERADRRGGGGGFVYSLAERMLNDESFEQRFGAFLSRHTTVRKQQR